MTDPLIPTVATVIGPAKDVIVAAREAAGNTAITQHVETGLYALLIAGWRGQFSRQNVLLADECKSARLGTAEGDALTPIAAVDYFTVRQPDPLAARGEVILARDVQHYVTGLPVTVAEATNEATSLALIAALSVAYIAHVDSVWSALTGAGSHLADDGSTLAAAPVVTMDDLVARGNAGKAAINLHVASVVAHIDADAVNLVTVDDAFVSDAGLGYSSQTDASKASLHRVLNANRTALNAHVALEARAGTVRRGTRFVIAADSRAAPPVLGATYEASADTSIRTGVTTITIPIAAPTTGTAGNVLAWVPGTGPTLAISTGAALFDGSQAAAARLAVSSLTAAGGRSAAQGDRELREAGRASYTGLRGPVDAALVAGALRGLGASRVAVITDYAQGGAYVHAVDESWAQSTAWLGSIAAILRDPEKGWLGTGCRLRGMGAVQNLLVRPQITITLRDARYLEETTELTASLTALTRSYFDDRADWYVRRSEALRSMLSAADPKRILSCTQVILRNAAGVPMTDTGAITAGEALVHNYLTDEPLDITYVVPS